MSEIRTVGFNTCVLGPIMARVYDLTKTSSVLQRNPSVLALNYETEVCMKEDCSLTFRY